MRQTKTGMWLVLALFVILLGVAYFIFIHKPANVNLVASPSAATMVVDGKNHVGVGKLYISPGKHTLVASFNGFATTTIDFTATNELTTVNVVLEPNSQAGYDWLNSHPNDVGIRQNIGGNKYNNSAQTLLREFPIVGDLPYDGPGGEYEVSYGAVSGSGSTSILEIDIIYYTLEGKQSALRWLQSQPSYNIHRFTIQYIDRTSTPPVVDNPGTH